MIVPVNPYPELIFKSKFNFNESHICESLSLILSAKDLGKSHLEQGNAKSSIADQMRAPHNNEIFKDFFNWLDVQANEIIFNQYKLSKQFQYYVGNSWVNQHGFDGKTIAHNHGFSALSCVAYLKLPDNSGFTEFKDPYYDIKSLHEYANADQPLKEFYPVEVEQNDVLIFPGWLAHRSQPNRNIKDRIILSANYINFTNTYQQKIGDFLNI